MTNRPGFDFRFVEMALDYLQSEDPGTFAELSRLEATDHLIRHARSFLYDIPCASAEDLVSALLSPPHSNLGLIPEVRRTIGYMRAEVSAGAGWVDDSLAYLPAGFRFDGNLFFTFGYDVGVAYPPNASLNLAFRAFHRNPREAVYYGIHELHHVGYFHYQAPPPLNEIATCSALLNLLEYLTHLEGMAVLAAWPRRKAEQALDEWSGDYRSMADSTGMERCVRWLLEARQHLAGRGSDEPGTEDFGIIEALSGPGRPAYRAGCIMALTIEEECGRRAVVDLIQAGPKAFFGQYIRLRENRIKRS